MQPTQFILNSRVVDSGTADNATATATVAAGPGERAYLSGFIAAFSATVATVKNVTITYTPEGTSTSVSIVIPCTFTDQLAIVPLPGLVHADYAGDITVALAASGSGGVTGRVYAFYALG